MAKQDATFSHSWQAPFNCKVWWIDKGQPWVGDKHLQKETPTELKKGARLHVIGQCSIQFESLA
jgi:hypothetical protein